MKNPVENLMSKLVQIADDRTSGSLDLVFAILDAFASGLSLGLYEIDKESTDAICKALRKLEDKQGFFVVVYKVILKLKEIFAAPQPDLKSLLSFIDSTKHYYDKLPERQVGDFLKFGIDTNKVLVHSNSHSVKSFLLALRKQGAEISKIYQTVSLPGGEGRVQAKMLQNEGFSVEMIDDEKVKKIVSAVDVAFFGADILFPISFINKAKTKVFCEQLHATGKPVVVIADKNKWVVDQNAEYFKSSALQVSDKQGTPLFEEIPNDLVDEFLIPDK